MKDVFLDIDVVRNRKKLPYGISNYEQLIEEGYYYVDKTRYMEKLENLPEKSIIFLRPRNFGKTLFKSTLENYYDINKKEKFEKLYGDTYIRQKPTDTCLYLLNKYLETGRMPDSLIDANIISAYIKIAKILSLCKREIIEKALTEEVTVSEIITEFNFEKEFTEKDMISVLFYFGYLTIKREELGYLKLKIPNAAMKTLYANYFLKMLEKN